MKKILFTGGGSAGHVIPNVAIMEELLSTGEADVCYMGGGGIERELIAKLKVPYYGVDCPKLIRGGGFSAFKNNLKIPFAFQKAVKKAEEGLRVFQPDLVFSKGGYVALPAVFAAKRLKIPCIAHESDFSAGLANKLSAKKCRAVLTAFPETAEKIKRGKYGGAPIRRSVLAAKRHIARKEWEIPRGSKVVLVFGGGSGSAAINEALRKSLKGLTESYLVLHVCGKGNVIESNLKNYRQYEFVADMGAAYACADVVVARAGAGTVFELLALKKPALLVPLEGATRGDQKQNAAYFQKLGLCRVLPQSELHRLAEEVQATAEDETLLEKLKNSNYAQGNARILGEIRALLRES